MPQYFFDVRDAGFLFDVKGQPLEDIAAAKIEGASLLGRLLQATPSQVLDRDIWQIEVRDENGLILFVVAVVSTGAQVLRNRT